MIGILFTLSTDILFLIVDLSTYWKLLSSINKEDIFMKIDNYQITILS